jgi:hypothetical protein
MAARSRAVPFRHVESLGLHQVLGHRHLPEHRHALLPRGGYRSAELTLRTTELADNLGRHLQAQTLLDTKLIDTSDVPPYVNRADQSGAVPFLDIGNHYITAGAQYKPQVLAGLSAFGPDRHSARQSVQPGGESDRPVSQCDHRGHRPDPAR